MAETYSLGPGWLCNSLWHNATWDYDCSHLPQTLHATLHPASGQLHSQDPSSNSPLGLVVNKRPEGLSNSSILNLRHDKIVSNGSTGERRGGPPVTSAKLSGSWAPTHSHDGRHHSWSGPQKLTNPPRTLALGRHRQISIVIHYSVGHR